MSGYKYSQEMYDKFDEMGKNAVKRFFAERNLKAVPNPTNKFVIDMYVYDGDELVALAEAEVRSEWTGKRFPFPTIHVPIRKDKYLHQDLPSFYFTINHDATATYVIDAQDVVKSNRHMTDTTRQKNELFFDVPLSKAKLHRIKKEIE